MFDGFGPDKLLFLFLIVLLFFGGKRLPEIGSSLGKGIREFKRGIRDIGEPMKDEEAEHVHPAGALPSSTTPAESVTYDSEHRAPKRLLEN